MDARLSESLSRLRLRLSCARVYARVSGHTTHDPIHPAHTARVFSTARARALNVVPEIRTYAVCEIHTRLARTSERLERALPLQDTVHTCLPSAERAKRSSVFRLNRFLLVSAALALQSFGLTDSHYTCSFPKSSLCSSGAGVAAPHSMSPRVWRARFGRRGACVARSSVAILAATPLSRDHAAHVDATRLLPSVKAVPPPPAAHVRRALRQRAPQTHNRSIGCLVVTFHVPRRRLLEEEVVRD